MLLQFPLARFLLQDLLNRRQMSGARAIASAAALYNLVATDSLVSILQAPNSEMCECFATTRLIVRSFFSAQKGVEKVRFPDLEIQVWQQILDHYEGQNVLSHGATDPNHSPKCSIHAPALFDILLQVLSRYP
jgi:hypothetical protein